MTEGELIKKYLRNMSSKMRLFRINAGMGWTGQKSDINHISRRENGKTVRYVTIKNPRPFIGAPKGWPDCAGWEEIEITPEMVGRKIAVFTAKEFKIRGNLMAHQKLFKKVLESMGGNFETVRPE